MTASLGFAILLLTTATPESKLDPSLKREVEQRLAIVREWAVEPIVVETVREANRSLRTMEETQEIDAAWREYVGVSEFMDSVISHPASERLRELRVAHPELKEAFVTDRQGANVATTNKTSDFYQGDESKFLAVFDRGLGAYFIGDVYRDESIQAMAIQISVPVVSEEETIGVLCVTVNLEKIR